jgi:hypothetical protein
MDAPPIAEKDGKDTIAGLTSLKDLLRLVQRKCNKRNLMTDPEKLSLPSPFPPRPVDPAVQFKVIKAVPALASPLTRTLNPVVTRAQWEIVVRSAAVAGVICWTIVGCLLAIPVGR